MTTTATPHRLHERLGRDSPKFISIGAPGLYATDASLYQIEPVGVVVPRTADDVVAVVRIAAEEGVPVVPRGRPRASRGRRSGRRSCSICRSTSTGSAWSIATR